MEEIEQMIEEKAREKFSADTSEHGFFHRPFQNRGSFVGGAVFGAVESLSFDEEDVRRVAESLDPLLWDGSEPYNAEFGLTPRQTRQMRQEQSRERAAKALEAFGAVRKES